MCDAGVHRGPTCLLPPRHSQGVCRIEVDKLLRSPAGLPVFTGPIYGWKGSQNGVLLGVLGIASLPVSFLVGYISPHVSDRSLTLAAVIVTGLGAALCTQAGLRKLAAAYFGGGGMLYLVGSSHCGPGSGLPEARDLAPGLLVYCKQHCQQNSFRAV